MCFPNSNHAKNKFWWENSNIFTLVNFSKVRTIFKLPFQTTGKFKKRVKKVGMSSFCLNNKGNKDEQKHKTKKKSRK